MKRKTDNFSKFFEKKSNSAIKEAFRQEKKAAKKERKEAIDRHFEEKRKAREQQFQSQAGSGGRPADKGFSGKNRPGQAGKPAAPSKGPQQEPQKNSPAAPVAHTPQGPAPHEAGALPLNKYIAHSGMCSRRDAAILIREGKVLVNNQLVTEPGTKVQPSDMVKVNGKKITMSRNFVYILLNKPKDYITTSEDPQGRKTVLDLIRHATTERVYPVGRLDRNTSGVLLFTNDGDLAQKLAHPKHEIKKIYHVTLDKPVTKADFDKIASGVELEDGIAYVDVVAYADARDKTQIGLEIHSGRNRIVRRIFEHLGYDVRGLDRVTYAGLTKKNVQRGKWRLLTEKEVRILKYMNSSFRGTPEKSKPAAAGKAAPKPSSAETIKTAASGKTPFEMARLGKPAPKADGEGFEHSDAKRVPFKREGSKRTAFKHDNTKRGNTKHEDTKRGDSNRSDSKRESFKRESFKRTDSKRASFKRDDAPKRGAFKPAAKRGGSSRPSAPKK